MRLERRTNIMETFGQRLARIRKEKNLTQNDLADYLSISPQAISKWESDLTSPDLDTIVKLANLFNMSTDELLGNKKTSTEFIPNQTKKDIRKMMFKIIVRDSDGDNVNINLPLGAVKILAKSKAGSFVLNNKELEGVDFDALIELVESGVVGELVSIDSKDGDKVIIKFE